MDKSASIISSTTKAIHGRYLTFRQLLDNFLISYEMHLVFVNFSEIQTSQVNFPVNYLTHPAGQRV